jgi:hypothetical protein
LTGVPLKDPGSDLWGSRVDVSTGLYDRKLKSVLPPEPQSSARVRFMDGGVLIVEEGSEFAEGEGEWKLVYEGGLNKLRFSLNTAGFERLTKNGGSLQVRLESGWED